MGDVRKLETKIGIGNELFQALKLVNQLVKELKKLDDKALLVEVQLLESKVC